jgi:DNA-binding winged helix-turn-helix (wHTH) protein/TolB-like protein/Tfp pilus assembly protein PilF
LPGVHAPSHVTARIYEFGEFRLDTAAETLARLDGGVVPLTPRAYATLRTLVEHPGELVERTLLMKTVWPNLVVEDNNLDQQVSLLRQALGERRGEHRYIVTVPGRGYRFVVPVRAQSEPAGEPPTAPSTAITREQAVGASPARRPWLWPAAVAVASVALIAGAFALLDLLDPGREAPSSRERTTLAVLPFKPMTASDSHESLELGVAETLIVGLNAAQLPVSPLSSVRRFAGPEQDALAAGRALAVDVVLESYIQRDGDALRVSTRLLDVADGRQLWSQSYDEQFSNILSVQDSIAERVLGALAPNLAGAMAPLRRYTSDAEAYQLYLDGQFARRRLSEIALREALASFHAAIERDPNFALAHVGLAECYSIIAVFGIEAPHETFPLARQAIDRALTLAPDLGEAYASLGHVKMQYEMDSPGAERALRRAIEHNPSYAPAHQFVGVLLGYRGQFDAALEELRITEALEPAVPGNGALRGMILSYQGLHDAAIEQLERLLAIAPDLPNTRAFLAMAYLRRGDLDLAAEHAGAIRSPAPGSRGYVGQIHALAGRRTEALAEIERLVSLSRERYVSAYDTASIYATLGEVDQTFAWLERAFEERSQIIGWLPWDGAFESIRTDPRYPELTKRLAVANR